MFLIRSAILLTLLVVLLPSEPREQERLYQTASHALHQAATFCDRNAAMCAEAQTHWTHFKAKLAIAGRMAADLVNERMTGQHVPAAPTHRALEPLPAAAARPRADTLGPSDRHPAWRAAPRNASTL